jgi:[acyl-carrier-protein] S-malonyltransferase
MNKLNTTPIYDAHIPVYTNVSAECVIKESDIRQKLFEQLTNPVRWEEIIKNMIRDGVEEFYEIGPGKVLQGLVKRINTDVKIFGIDKYSDVEKYL